MHDTHQFVYHFSWVKNKKKKNNSYWKQSQLIFYDL